MKRAKKLQLLAEFYAASKRKIRFKRVAPKRLTYVTN